MEEISTPSEFAMGYLDGIKKDYQKMKECCTLFEQEQKSLLALIGLDLNAFSIKIHPEYPALEVFQLAKVSERDQQKLAAYLSKREKLYLLEQCVRSIIDDDTRRIAEAYYLERKPQPEIAAEIGRTKSYVSKKLDKAEKESMVETIDRYFAWKYSIPGGKDCFWADEKERQYMRKQDAQHGILRLPDVSKMPWMKTLRRMGLIK